jgi:hypothetical protein
MAKDLKCPVNAHRHIVGDVRTFRLPAQTKKFFIHEPTDSRRNARRGSRLWRRAFVLGRVCTLSRIDVQSCARNRESRAPAHRFSSRHEFLVGAFGSRRLICKHGTVETISWFGEGSYWRFLPYWDRTGNARFGVDTGSSLCALPSQIGQFRVNSRRLRPPQPSFMNASLTVML